MRLPPHMAVQVAEIVQIVAQYAATAGHERQPLDALRFVESGHRHCLLLGNSIVCFNMCIVVSRLGTPLAILGTMSRAGVDDGAAVEGTVAEFAANLVGRGI